MQAFLRNYGAACPFDLELYNETYTTKSKIIVNGRNQHLIFERDLKNIHKIINIATKDRSEDYIKSLNAALAHQLERLIAKVSTNHETNKMEPDMNLNILKMKSPNNVLRELNATNVRKGVKQEKPIVPMVHWILFF